MSAPFAHEWPKGHRLFSVKGEDIHLSFNWPGGDEGPAVLLQIDAEKNRCTVLAVKVFDNDADALDWYERELEKRKRK